MALTVPLSASAASYGPMAWGDNGSGELGDGTNTNSTSPVEVKGLKEVTAVASGVYHSLALLRDGTVRAWGNDSSGELGDGHERTSSNVPVEVKGLTEVTSIAAGGFDGLALLKDGTVRDWGLNATGELGNGTTTNSAVPVELPGLKDVAAIAGGYGFTLALLRDGTVRAWGENSDGQLGVGTNSGPERCMNVYEYSCSTVPVEVKGLKEVTAIAAGASYGLALLRDGTVRSWGGNWLGQLGDGTDVESSLPVEVAGLKEVTAIAAGGYHGMALVRDGTVRTWGYNSSGQLGNGTNTNTNVPVVVTGLREVAAIAGGGQHSLARLKTGTVSVWGFNGGGQLGRRGHSRNTRLSSPPSCRLSVVWHRRAAPCRRWLA